MKSVANPKDEFGSQAQNDQTQSQLNGLELDHLPAGDLDRSAIIIDARAQELHASALNGGGNEEHGKERHDENDNAVPLSRRNSLPCGLRHKN